MLALRVPCDARMSWRGVKLAALKQHTPKSPAHPVLLGKPERDFKINIKSRIGSKIVGPNLFGQ